jgi:hypothetical protein
MYKKKNSFEDTLCNSDLEGKKKALCLVDVLVLNKGYFFV